MRVAIVRMLTRRANVIWGIVTLGVMVNLVTWTWYVTVILPEGSK